MRAHVDTPAYTIFHLDDARPWSAAGQQALYLHQGLLAQGHDSRVICQHGGAMHARLRDARLPHYAMRMVGGFDPGTAWRLRKLLDDPTGILHTHSTGAHELGLWTKRLGARAKLMVTRHDGFPARIGRLDRWRYLSRRVDCFLAVSSAVEWQLGRAGVESARIRRIPVGIDLTRVAGIEPDLGWRMRLGLQPGELLFCSVAELAPQEDQATLLGAFRHFLDQGGQGRLVILGEGALHGELERRKKQLGLDAHVFIPGSAEGVLARLRAADVFVTSSRAGGPATDILDAMALARPVIATSAGEFVDAVAHEETGLLVPPGDAHALARALGDLQESAATRQRMGLAGQRKVEEFDLARTVRLTIEAYQELLSPQGA